VEWKEYRLTKRVVTSPERWPKYDGPGRGGEEIVRAGQKKGEGGIVRGKLAIIASSKKKKNLILLVC